MELSDAANPDNGAPRQAPTGHAHGRRGSRRRKHSTMGLVSCGLALLAIVLGLIAIPAKSASGGVVLVIFILLTCAIFGLCIVGMIAGFIGLTSKRRRNGLPMIGLALNPLVGAAFLVYLWWPGAGTIVTAAANGDLDAIHSALGLGIDVNTVDLFEDTAGNTVEGTALVAAAMNGKTDALVLLIEKGAKVDARDGLRRTALYHAAEQGHTDAVAALLDAGADPNDNPPGRTALYHAADRGDDRMAELLLKHRAAVNTPDSLPLLAAAARGSTNIIDLLVRHEADINARRPEDENAAVHLAAAQGHLHVVRRLIHHRADVSLTNRYRETAMELAIHAGHRPVIDELLNAGSPIDIFAAIGLGDTARVRQDLDRDPSLVRLTKRNLTPLHVAAQRGEVEIAKQLIATAAALGEVKAAVAARTQQPLGLTPLYLAVDSGQTAIALLLLEQRASPNERVQTGGVNAPPLYFAVVDDHDDLVDTLLAYGADVNMSCQTEEGSDGSPLLFAAERGHAAVAKLLLDHKADVNLQKNVNTPTPLIAAIRNADVDMVKLLLDYRADPNIPLGQTSPVQMVKELQRHQPEKYEAIRLALQAHGALDE